MYKLDFLLMSLKKIKVDLINVWIPNEENEPDSLEGQCNSHYHREVRKGESV